MRNKRFYGYRYRLFTCLTGFILLILLMTGLLSPAFSQETVPEGAMYIGLTGSPGAGKTTHGQLLSKRYGIPVISVGAILREEIAKKTPLGLEAAPYVEKGELCPSEIVSKVVKKRIAEKDCRKGFIMDGYPRKRGDLEVFEEIMKELGITSFRMVYLEVKPEELIERLASRRVCDKGHQYDLRQNPPKKEGICDIDGLPLKKRKDDAPEVIRHRFEVFQEETLPVIGYFKKQGRLITVDGSGLNDVVEARLHTILDPLQKKEKQ